MEELNPLKLSVIIPAYKTSSQVLDRCLRSILKQAQEMKDLLSLEIIVVDSSSTQIPQDLETQSPLIRYLLPGKRLYPGEARNWGVKQSKGDYFIFIDSDCEWNEGWLRKCLQHLKQTPSFLGAHGSILFARPRISWSFALHLIEFHEFLKTNHEPQRFLLSANLVLTKDFFQSLQGFEEAWPACEDIALLRNLKASEKIVSQIAYLPEMSITHADHVSQMRDVFTKMKFMGYWRGRLDRHFPKEVKFTKPTMMRSLPFLIGPAFAALILKRSLSYPMHYRLWMWLNLPLILILCFIWGKGVGAGLMDTDEPLPKHDSARPSAPYRTLR